jgi:hypothetical protein
MSKASFLMDGNFQKNGTGLDALRKQLGWSHRELARRIDKSHTTVGRMIRGDAIIDDELWPWLLNELAGSSGMARVSKPPRLRDHRCKRHTKS